MLHGAFPHEKPTTCAAAKGVDQDGHAGLAQTGMEQCLANNLMMAGSVRGGRGAGLRPAMPPFLAGSCNSLAVNLLENKSA